MTNGRAGTKMRAAIAAALVALVAAAVALLAGSLQARAADRAAKVTIRVTIRDTAFVLSKKTAPAGTVVFSVKNAGKLTHTFSIGGKKTPVLKTGRSAVLTVVFKKAGAFVYRSTLAGQTKLKGTFKVTAAASSGSGSSAAGMAVFKSAGCGNCHVLKAAGSHGTVGPDLDTIHPSLSTIVDQVTHGGRFMPPFGASAGGSLSDAQIKDVAAFVYASEH